MDLDALLEAPEGIKRDIASLPWNEHWDSAGAQGLWADDPWWQQLPLPPRRPHSMQGPEVLAGLPQHLGFCGPRAAWAGADLGLVELRLLPGSGAWTTTAEHFLEFSFVFLNVSVI